MFNFITKSVSAISLVVALFVSLALMGFLFVGDLWKPHWVAISLIFAISTYYFSSWAISRLINERIRPLYLFIGSHNSKPRDRDSHKTISKLEDELRLWAQKSNAEMTNLRSMENYRKEFLGNVSHELKTPLFSLQGFIDTLIAGAVNDPVICKKYLERSDKNVERLINIVHDLEEISRLESSTLVLHKSDFDISTLISEVYLAMESLYREAGIEMKYLQRNPVFVCADRKRIEQVLTNLMSNAMKYNRPNGSVVVKLTDMFDSIMISVSDTGFGIEAEHIPRLFERFYRIDKARSRDVGGTGLGLAIVKHTLEAHNQRINVRSEVGVGTTFFFTLPKAKSLRR
ncbi:MAG: ATP-binding protein [Rikenellaceae bacterium]